MAVTPFLKLQKPPFDTIPWDQAVNGNMDTIDAFISRYMAVPNYMGAWTNSTAYVSGQNVLDITNAIIYQCAITHTSSATPTTFAQDRTTYPTYWVATQNVITGGAGNTVLTIAEATPLTAKAGDLWWDSLGGQLYVMYNDGNSLQWVIANNQAGNVGEAPNDGSVYGRRMSAWTPISQGNVGRNLIHNSMFNIAQRGVGPFTATGYIAALDRWPMNSSADAISVSQVALTDGDRTAIGDEAARFAYQNTFTGNAGAGAFNQIVHALEGVWRVAGKTVTLSFWAKAASGTPKLGLNILEFFGTGGSPSAAVWALATGNSVTLSTVWTRYSTTIAVPSIVGLTIGTNNDHFTRVAIWCSSGSGTNALAGNIGVQSATIQLWGVQLEIAAPGQTQPTPLEKPDPELQLRQCQRFYQVIPTSFLLPVNPSTVGWTAGWTVGLNTAMRANPSVVFTSTTLTNATSLVVGNPLSNTCVNLGANAVATTGGFGVVTTVNASADL